MRSENRCVVCIALAAATEEGGSRTSGSSFTGTHRTAASIANEGV